MLKSIKNKHTFQHSFIILHLTGKTKNRWVVVISPQMNLGKKIKGKVVAGHIRWFFSQLTLGILSKTLCEWRE